jgi:hypothetical protein
VVELDRYCLENAAWQAPRRDQTGTGALNFSSPD